MSKTYVITTTGENSTIKLGEILSKVMEKRVMALSGDLGAGKTYLAKGVAKGMGIDAHITSPTFNILNIYENGSGAFYHMDAYRIDSERMMDDIDTSDMFKPEGITLIEWAENIDSVLPDNHVNIFIQKTADENKRMFFITADKQTIDGMAILVDENTFR